MSLEQKVDEIVQLILGNPDLHEAVLGCGRETRAYCGIVALLRSKGCTIRTIAGVMGESKSKMHRDLAQWLAVDQVFVLSQMGQADGAEPQNGADPNPDVVPNGTGDQD